MNQKNIGIIFLIISILIASFVLIVKLNNNSFVDHYVEDNGTCYLDDGTCLHEKDLSLYIFGWVISGVLLLFGIYLTFIDKTQQIITEHQVKVSSALESAQKSEREKDEFNAFILGFEESEQTVLKAIHVQDGIKQSTLRYRTNISKTSLSLILKKLENKNFIFRKKSGKTKEVYLIKKF